MTKIHGMVYIMIGVIVLLVSWFLRRDKLVVFIYASFIMIAMGVVKLTFSGKKEQVHSRREAPRETAAVISHSSVSHSSPTPSHHSHASRHRGINKTFNKTFAAKNSPEIKKCLRCTNILNSNDKFCSRCGARVVR